MLMIDKRDHFPAPAPARELPFVQRNERFQGGPGRPFSGHVLASGWRAQIETLALLLLFCLFSATGRPFAGLAGITFVLQTRKPAREQTRLVFACVLSREQARF